MANSLNAFFGFMSRKSAGKNELEIFFEKFQ